jgi:hypothetical protein
MSIETTFIINALTTVLSKMIEQATSDSLFDPANKKLQEFLQRSYKRKDAEAEFKRAIESVLNEFADADSEPVSNWLFSIATEKIKTRPELAAKIAETAIEMKSADENNVPDDLILSLGIARKDKQKFARFLFRLRQELAKIDGYSQAIAYVDNLHTRGMLTDLYNTIQVADDSENRVIIKSGSTEIIASGLVTSFNGNPIEINYGPRIERLTLIFAFQDDERQETRIDATKPNPNTLKLTLYNFRSPLGSGTPKPVPIGSLGGQKLLIHYRVYDIGNSDKTVHYTIYRSGESSYD